MYCSNRIVVCLNMTYYTMISEQPTCNIFSLVRTTVNYTYTNDVSCVNRANTAYVCVKFHV